MAQTKENKKEVIEKIKAAAKDAATLVFVNFHGLSVAATSAMRRALREQGVGYFVAKKTLLRRALSEGGFSGELPELSGEVAITWGSDPVLPASTVHKFVKQNEGALSILGGIYEGRYIGKDEMATIATIPPLPVLRGMFVNIINSPIQGLVIALNQVAEKKA